MILIERTVDIHRNIFVSWWIYGKLKKNCWCLGHSENLSFKGVLDFDSVLCALYVEPILGGAYADL